MDPLRERYTDADLRHDPTLITTAVAYALAYEGDFEFMRNARSYAERNGTLSVLVARGVLNCAVRDPYWADQLPAPRPVLRVVKAKPPKPRKPVDLAVRWRFTHFRTQAEYPAAPERPVHLLNPDRSGIRLWPDDPAADWWLTARCGQRVTDRSPLLIFTSNGIPDGHRLCLQCLRLMGL